jgi:hypothetical protein
METRRNETLEMSVYRVPFRAAEEPFRGGIEQSDSSTVVDDDDCVRRRRDSSRESLFVSTRLFAGRAAAVGIHKVDVL